jgi:hypothetical protein
LTRLQERILLAGIAGCGKTYGWLTIAQTFPDSKFYVIDPDDGVRRVWFNEFPEVNNIEYYNAPRWYTDGSEKLGKIITIDKSRNCYMAGIADAWKVIKPKLKTGDWVIVEHLGNIWNRVQEGFADEVFSKDIGQYFLEVRKEMKPGGKRLDALEGWTDWQVINKLYGDDFIIPLCFENPAHLLLTSAVSVTSSGSREDEGTKAVYGESRIRIEGQKSNIFRVQSILLMTSDGKGKQGRHWFSTFLKDRGRDWVERKEWSNFAIDYLMDVAKWEL